MRIRHTRVRTAAPLAPKVQCCVVKSGDEGGACEYVKLRNADFCKHAPTLVFGARGCDTFIAHVLHTPCCTHLCHMDVVANFLPSTVANFFIRVMFACCGSSVRRSFCVPFGVVVAVAGAAAMPTARMTPDENTFSSAFASLCTLCVSRSAVRALAFASCVCVCLFSPHVKSSLTTQNTD